MTSSMFNLRNVVLLCSLVALSHSKQLPSFVKPCKKNDPHLDQCLINLITGLKPRLKTGIREMRIPPLEPFFVPEVKLDTSTSQSVRFKAEFYNLTLRTGLNFDVKKVKIDFNKPSLYIDVLFPHVKIDSTYNIDGQVLVVPIKGHGPCRGNFTNVSVQLTANGKYIPKENKSYLEIVTRKLILKIGGLHLVFENLFGGKNKALADTTNEFINENWKDIIQELNPLLEDTIGKILMSVVAGFLDTFAIQDLFPNS